MPGKRKQPDALATLLKTAPSRTVKELLVKLAATRPDTRRECFEYLKKHAPLSARQQKQSEGEAVLVLWSDLDSDLHNVLPYIESGNAGLDDGLYDVAYAACYDNYDLRALAEAFERMPGDW